MQGTMVHEGEEDHARPGWTTSRRGQDSPWKSQSEWQRTEINGESTFMVWPTLGSRTAKEQNRTEQNIRTCRGIWRLLASDNRTCGRLRSRRSTTSYWCRTRWNRPCPATVPPHEVSTDGPQPALAPSSDLYHRRQQMAKEAKGWKDLQEMKEKSQHKSA